MNTKQWKNQTLNGLLMERFGYGKAKKPTCEEVHPGMSHDQYLQENELEEGHCVSKRDDKSVEEGHCVSKRDEETLEEAEEVKNPGKYKTGQEEGYDDDADGVPNGADSDPKDGSKQ